MKIANSFKALTGVALISGLAAMPAIAAVQGSLDSTSTGSSDISLTVNDSVKITGLDDVTFPAYGASDTGAINQGDAFCVYRNGADGYNITASNPNGAEFSIVSAITGDTIQYSLALDESADASAASVITYNQPVAFKSGSDEVDCGDETNGVNTAFDIRIGEQEIRDASTGTYTGTLQLLVEPI